jgi:hypothetical protein
MPRGTNYIARRICIYWGRRKSSCRGDSLREICTSVDVLKEEKQGSKTNVRVLEELREKVISLDAEADAGRRGRDAW